MKHQLLIFLTILTSSVTIDAQEIDTYYLKYAKSHNDTIIYKRIISINKGLYHVKDYYPNGQIQLEGTYSFFDKKIKEKSLWCNYKTNTKEGEFNTWHESGQLLRAKPIIKKV